MNMQDMESHEITLADQLTPHIFVAGCSGYGKTVAACQQLENIFRQGGNALVIDISHSYTPKELNKSKANFPCTILNPTEENAALPIGSIMNKNAAEHIAAALKEALEINSPYQDKLLADAMEAVLDREGMFSFPMLAAELESRLKSNGSQAKDTEHVEKLLNRLNHLRKLDSFMVTTEDVPKDSHQAYILQFSGLPETAKHQLTCFCLHLLWTATKQSRGNPPYGTLLLDEFQNLPQVARDILYDMLREGRKLEFRLILCTQSISLFIRAERSAMEQGTILVFHPPETDLWWLEKVLGHQWREILTSLEVGQAVLYGHYHIGETAHVATTPIVVHINMGSDGAKNHA